MAPHLSARELGRTQVLSGRGRTTGQIRDALAAQRARRHVAPPDLTTIRRALRGETFRRGLLETRGRKAKLTRIATRRLNSARKSLIQKAQGEREVHWGHVLRAARVPKVHPSTAARSLRRDGYDVRWRAPRERPQRSPLDERLRMDICGRWRYLPTTYFAETADLIMDNKKFQVPTHLKAARHLKQTRVRGHFRTRTEGKCKGFTKPNARKHRLNPGGVLNVCAGIINCRVRVWHYLPKTWNGEVAAETYRGPIRRALVQRRGEKARYVVVEDNDPKGYKSKEAVAAKVELGIHAMQFPKYSPDLNPLDFYLWDAVERRMRAARSAPKSVAAYKAKLRRVAMSIPEAEIRAAVLSINARAKAVHAAKGRDIARD